MRAAQRGRRLARRGSLAPARVDDAAWGWRHVACFLVVLLVVPSLAYLYAQGAAALLQTFNDPVSLGSEWEALASRNVPIPSLPRDWPFP